MLLLMQDSASSFVPLMLLGGKVPIENELPEEMEAFFNTRADGYEAHMAGIPETSYWRNLLDNQLTRGVGPRQVTLNPLVE